MNEYLSILRRTKLFSGVGEEEIVAMLGCLQAKKRDFRKGAYVFREGEQPDCICVLVQGKLHLQKDDYWGNRSIMNMISEGELFGEAYATPGGEPLLHDVVAVEDSVIICFDIRRVLTVCPSACRFHTTVVQNLFVAISAKNRALTRKLNHMAQRTTREKLLSYLSEQSKREGSPSFEIPFNRQQLADFLSVDRSAMSNELCKMRDDGLLLFEKNRFTLL